MYVDQSVYLLLQIVSCSVNCELSYEQTLFAACALYRRQFGESIPTY